MGCKLGFDFFQHVDSSESRDHLEVSPESAVVVKTLSTRIAKDGGVALIADYGHDGEKGDTFRVNIGFDLFSPFTTIVRCLSSADVQ